MQLSLEKSSNPIVEAAEPSSPRRVDPTVDTSLGRTRYPSPFLQMLSDLSDSPARPGGPSDGTIGVVDPHPNPVGGATTTATSDGHPTQASVLVDATMDGRDPPVVRGHLTRCEFTVTLNFFTVTYITQSSLPISCEHLCRCGAHPCKSR